MEIELWFDDDDEYYKTNNLPPVLKINDHTTGGRRTKDILGGPKGWGPKKKGRQRRNLRDF